MWTSNGKPVGSLAGDVVVSPAEELPEQALVFVRDQLSTRARTGRFAEPQSVDGTAPAIDRLAGFLGRSVPPRL
jgi:hypothetical protein